MAESSTGKEMQTKKKQTLHEASAFFGIIQFVVWAADCIIFQTDSTLWRI